MRGARARARPTARDQHRRAFAQHHAAAVARNGRHEAEGSAGIHGGERAQRLPGLQRAERERRLGAAGDRDVELPAGDALQASPIATVEDEQAVE